MVFQCDSLGYPIFFLIYIKLEAPPKLGIVDFAAQDMLLQRTGFCWFCCWSVTLGMFFSHLSASLFTFTVLHNTNGLRFNMLSDFVKKVCVSVSYSICCFCEFWEHHLNSLKNGSLLLHFKWNKAGRCRLYIIDMFDAKKVKVELQIVKLYATCAQKAKWTALFLYQSLVSKSTLLCS